jgi:hypothetical protein
MKTKYTLRQKKLAYVTYVETLVKYGYDISDFLNPTFKKICPQKCVDLANEIIEDHEGKDVWKYNEKKLVY